MITDTSLDAYAAIGRIEESQMSRVYDYICRTPYQCSREIADNLGIHRTSVTARLKKLEKDGLIRKGDKKKDEVTGITVYWYEPVSGGH